MNDLLDSLTPAQREAATHVDGPLLILAGPGSGKTRVITHRIAYLLRLGVPARQILALTFTNKAAGEMQARVDALAPGQKVWMSTFHRFCARLLREYASLVGLEQNFTIYDTADSQQALKRTLDELNYDPVHYTPNQIGGAISWAKNHALTPEKYDGTRGGPMATAVARVYPAYQALLLRSNAVDFDDLLLHVASMLREHPDIRRDLDARYRYVMVDEYQDTNLAQYAIVRALCIDYPNLAVTGDPDQSIYGWRGAHLANILDFERDFPRAKVVRLELNYRSTKRILRVAQALIRQNRLRKEKGLFTDNDEGAPVRFRACLTQRDEVDYIADYIADEVRANRRRFRDFAVFYRTNALSRVLESALRERGIRYQMVHGVEFYQRREIKDVLAYLVLINNPRDDNALLRVINLPPRGIGKGTVDRLVFHARQLGHPLLESARASGTIDGLPKKAAVAVAKFVALFDRLGEVAFQPLEAILGNVLTESGYRKMLLETKTVEDAERLANIEELLSAAREFDEQHPGDGHLEEFLEQVCLVNETDDWESQADCATLMTLHAAKGLEFPVVFIIALEQELIPHERSQEQPQDLEEERRLLFVGMTRAKQELHLSLARHREFRGRRRMSVPSDFLLELPAEEVDGLRTNWAELHEPVLERFDGYLEDQHEEVPAAIRDHRGFEPRVMSRRSRSSGSLKVQTAAELAANSGDASPGTSSPAVPVEAFCQGMVVLHPEYGLGTIVALSGGGQRRSATVSFASQQLRKNFILAQSVLRPVRAPS